MDIVTENSSSTKTVEAVPGPSTEEVVKSAKSRKGIKNSATNKRVKHEKKGVGNKKTEIKKAKKKIMDDKSRTAAMSPFTRNRVNSMVMDSITKIGKRVGASFSDIEKYMKENYKANMELLDSYVKGYLKSCVEKGLLVSVKRSAGEDRFKKAKQNNNLKGEMDAHGKNMEKTSMHNSENLREKAAGYTTDELLPENHSRDQTAESINITENLEITPEPSTNEVTETSSLNEKSAKAVSKKRTRQNDEKSDIENKKQKTVNAEVEKVEVVSEADRRNLKSSKPKTSEMVMNAIKSLKKRNGAKLEDIMKYIEENHQVNMKVFKPHINRFLSKSVEGGILQKLGGADAEGRYKIPKQEKAKKDSSKKSAKRKRV